MGTTDTYSAAEAAHRLGVSVQVVRKRAARRGVGHRPVTVRDDWRFSAADLAAIRADLPRGGASPRHRLHRPAGTDVPMPYPPDGG